MIEVIITFFVFYILSSHMGHNIHPTLSYGRERILQERGKGPVGQMPHQLLLEHVATHPEVLVEPI